MPTSIHLTIRVCDLPSARAFYGGLLGCHVIADTGDTPAAHNPVDGHDVPVPHFGMVLEMPDWEALAAQLRKAGVAFVIEPHVRCKGQPGEQATMFLTSPSGNALEF